MLTLNLGLLATVLAVVLLILAMVGMMLVLANRRDEHTRLSYEEAHQAAVHLHRIGQRLEVARMRAELHRDAETLKERLAEALYERRP